MRFSKRTLCNFTLFSILICGSPFLSCKNFQNEKNAKIYNDTIYEYFDDENSKLKQKKWKTNDSLSYVINFNNKGKVKSKGRILFDSLKFDKWTYFITDQEENYKEIREYKLIDGKEYLNQDWLINSKNDTVMGHFISHNSLKDEYVIGDTIEVQFYYPKPLMSKNSELYLVYAKEGNFNNTFSNINSLTLDTLSNVYRLNYLMDNKFNQYKRSVYRNYILKSTGKNHIRHIFLEKFDTIYNDTLSTSFVDIYFEKEIYVKDTIENMKDEISQK
jgi:hypothetical protein